MPDNSINLSDAKDKPKTITPDMLDHEVTIKVYGEEKTMPLKDALAIAQKSEAVESKFKELHDQQAAFETELATNRDLREGFKERDSHKIKRAFMNVGLTEKQIEELFDPSTASGGSAQGTGESDGGMNDFESDDDSDGGSSELAQTVQQLQAEVAGLKGDQAKAKEQDNRSKVMAQVDRALDKHAELSKILRQVPEEERNDFRELAYKYVSKASDTMPWGPRAIQKGLDETLKRIQSWGGGSSTLKATDEQGTPGSPGFGPSGISASNTLHPHKETKLVPVTDASYQPNMLKRFAEKVARIQKRRGG